MNYSFGEKLRTLRTGRGLSQEELAEKLNEKYGKSFNKGMISKWENDREEPRMDAVRSIVSYFNVSLDDLLGLTQMNIVTTSYSDHDLKLLKKYSKLDSRGKHTVNTVLDMEYNRVNKPHLEVVAAHADDYSEEQQDLIRRDIDKLDKM